MTHRRSALAAAICVSVAAAASAAPAGRKAAGPVNVYGSGAGQLRAIAAGNGNQLKTWKLPAPPVYEGLAAAGGKLYVATQDSKVICFGKR